jgi:hypothetical protein
VSASVRRVELEPLLHALADVDALSKGIGRGDAWVALRTLALTLAGKPAVPLATIPAAALDPTRS